MDFSTQGWTFADSTAASWNPVAPGVEMKPMGAADTQMIALFRFAPGYSGAVHHHQTAEFSYVLDGELHSQGTLMTAGHSYAVQSGTDHNEFRTDTGCTIVSVFARPS
jgi:quercetin dioxygenase-like cupin family protein